MSVYVYVHAHALSLPGALHEGTVSVVISSSSLHRSVAATRAPLHSTCFGGRPPVVCFLGNGCKTSTSVWPLARSTVRQLLMPRHLCSYDCPCLVGLFVQRWSGEGGSHVSARVLVRAPVDGQASDPPIQWSTPLRSPCSGASFRCIGTACVSSTRGQSSPQRLAHAAGHCHAARASTYRGTVSFFRSDIAVLASCCNTSLTFRRAPFCGHTASFYSSGVSRLESAPARSKVVHLN